MKPSKLKKDSATTIRISKKVREKLRAQGLSAQKVFDRWIDENLSVSVTVSKSKDGQDESS